MPSDSKKREQQRKKDAQKKRNQNFAVTTKDSQADEEITITNGVKGTNGEVTTNGTTNGTTSNGGPVELTEEGMSHTYNFFFTFCLPTQRRK